MTIERKPAKPKKCRVATCRASFIPARLGQAVCSHACALIDGPRHAPRARKALADIERAEIKVRKEKLKSRAEHMKDTQQAFNEFIRWRDRIAGHACISSGRPLNWLANEVDAGHYRSVGSAPHMRFDENNCHAQSKQDNRYLSGNAIDYRIGLIKRIGLEAVEVLESDQSVRKYTVEQLKAMTADYRAKTRELKKGEAA